MFIFVLFYIFTNKEQHMKNILQKRMKNILLSLLVVFQSFIASATVYHTTNEPDSVYLFSYATVKDAGHSGLKLAWSPDGKQWFSVGNAYGFVKCDYGAWGSQKRMYHPHLMKGTDDLWHCIWKLNESGQDFGHAASRDLIKWTRQTYFTRNEHPSFLSVLPSFRKVTETSVILQPDTLKGYLQKVPYSKVNSLIEYVGYRSHEAELSSERTEQDPQRFAGLKPVNATLKVEAESAKAISDKLIGIFFEDINYAADGGLYAELIQNRDFEYTPTDRRNDQKWNSTHSWGLQGEHTTLSISTDQPVHPNNPHYAVLEVQEPGASLINGGYDGIAVKKGLKYNFSLFSKMIGTSKKGKIKVSLISKDGKEIASTVLSLSSSNWKKRSAVLTATADAPGAQLAICPQKAGTYALDMISLFPQNTFKGHKNGLRPDLAQTLADLHPRFVRFPGGCVSHGDGIDNIYHWKNSIGPLEARKPMRNLWGYHQTLGLGFYEYFQFCEDIGAAPVPVLAAGVPCQNSSTCSHYSHRSIDCGGQQSGIPMSEMGQYVQDILDLIEYANGDPKQTKWGKIRAQSGHPKPFNLKYIGIGNEDLITDVFEERYTMICNAIREKYPEITIIGTVGPFCEGTDYEEGWAVATKLKLPMVDEHYYQTPGWFLNHQDFYDRYDRTKSKVYLGEYAAHLPGRPSNMETALVEALYLTAIERNGDVVSMTSYAPLLAKEGHTQWRPDLIYFNNTEVKPTVDYYVQQLYGQNSGDTYLPSSITLDNTQDAVKKRIATSVVRDSRTNDLIIKLVNLLPVDTQLSISLPSIPEGGEEASVTVLSGTPGDKDARPVTGSMQIKAELPYRMPPYSFTVIRIPSQKNNPK